MKHQTNKSLFASFSSEKEDSSFFEKKEAKKLLVLRRFTVREKAFACGGALRWR
jgi:hypothetical protein